MVQTLLEMPYIDEKNNWSKLIYQYLFLDLPQLTLLDVSLCSMHIVVIMREPEELSKYYKKNFFKQVILECQLLQMKYQRLLCFLGEPALVLVVFLEVMAWVEVSCKCYSFIAFIGFSIMVTNYVKIIIDMIMLICLPWSIYPFITWL